MPVKEILEDNAFMVLWGFAFCFEKDLLKVYNLNRPEEFATYRYGKDRFFYKESNLNEADTYKVLAIVERNKEELLKGYNEWESIQNNI